ncbi:hypothetical protein K7432_001010 [Basidiobolus ranarum]|uniref:Uncharacterized protein n=1 Tax=Basidiobolus ranarum TaxID=34480 RepID=A0ABR2X3T1_9FUNG
MNEALDLDGLDKNLVFRNNFTTILVAFAFPIAIQGIYRSIKIALSETLVIYKLNFAQCSFFLINVVIDLLAVFYRKHSCPFQFYLYQIISFVSFLLFYLILLLKAYYASKAFKLIGVVFVLGQVGRLVGTVQTIRSSTITQESIGLCSIQSDPTWSLLLLVSETVIVVFLSFMFMKKILAQSKYIPSKVYTMLMKHGFVFPVAICVVNIIFSILLFSKISAISIDHLLRIGWIANAWLIMKQTENSHYLHKQGLEFDNSELHETTILSNHKDIDLQVEDSWSRYLGVKPSGTGV